MGIYDRDYARPSSNRGFGGGMQRSQKLSVNAWLIISCIAVFVLDPFISYTFQEWLHLSTDHVLQYWRFIGFQFLHADMQHLIFNMIGLYFFGSLVEQFLGGKRYLAFYLLCGMFGAVLYLLLNLGGIIVGKDVPILLFNDTSVRLIGASAGVFGVLLAGAFLAPKVRVLVFFVIPMQLSTMAYLLVGLALYTVIFAELTNIGSVANAGGEAAHLGGAAAGWYFIRNPHHLNGFFDFLGKADPTSKHFALGKKKTVRSDVDKILDKIHRKGLNSLSTKEKKILHDASQDRREGK
jgi:membrane associated rhomboid family serine protease